MFQNPESNSKDKLADDDKPNLLGQLVLGKDIKRRVGRMASNINLFDYFADDETEKMNKRQGTNEYYFQDSEVNFSILQYMEMLMHHVLYFGIFGPFLNLLMICSKDIRYLYKNNHFYKCGTVFSIAQVVYWVVTMLVYYGYFVDNASFPAIDSNTLKATIISVFLRSTSIAGKYATFPKVLIRKYKEKLLTAEEFGADLMLIDWRVLKAHVRQKEILNCFERLEIDRNAFFISFMAKVPERLHKAMEDYQTEDNEKEEYQVKVETKFNSKEMVYYNCKYILECFLEEFKKVGKKCEGMFSLVTLVVSLGWGFGPVFLRIYFGESSFGMSWFEITVNVLSCIVGGFLFFTQITFYKQAVDDIDRKEFLMNQVGYLMSPMKVKEYSYDKVMPTINIVDPISLATWVNLRRTCVDFGRKFFYRHEIFLPVSILLAVLPIVVLAILWYMVQKANMFQGNVKVLQFMWYLILDSVIFLFITFHFLYKAGSINQTFQDHLILIKRNKTMLLNLIQSKDYYFEPYLKNPIQEFNININTVLTRKSDSFLHLKLRKEIALILGERIDADLDSYLENLLKTYDSLMEELSDEERFYSIKVLGMPVTKDSVIGLFIGGASTLIAGYQLFFGEGN